MMDSTPPPSARRAAPFVADEASLAIYTIKLAISFGSINRFISDVGYLRIFRYTLWSLEQFPLLVL